MLCMLLVAVCAKWEPNTGIRTRRTVVGHFGIVVAKKRDARTKEICGSYCARLHCDEARHLRVEVRW